MEECFKRYPDVEVFADPLEPVYRVKYTECVEERGVLRFVRHQARVPKEELESLLAEVVRRSEGRGE